MKFSIENMAINARNASFSLTRLSTQQKDTVLKAMADKLVEGSDLILAENERDVANAKANGLSDAMIDRLCLTPDRIQSLAKAIMEVAQLPDPVGAINDMKLRPNGMQVAKMRIPLGVIGMIYESRPNVTAEAAALCFKSGNAVILRGGKEALHSNLIITNFLQAALIDQGIDPNVISIVPDTNRAVVTQLIQLSDYIDLIIPRGGEPLIRFVTENSRIPVIKHFKGNCHLYVDESADIEMGIDLLLNGKTQRVSACNSIETLLVHKNIAPSYLPAVAKNLAKTAVKVHACENSLSYFQAAEPATPADWETEYLALEIAIKVVDDFDCAIEHIEEFSSNHTEVICTQNYSNANEFVRRVNSAVVMVNASSRFADGGQLGLGAEIGISTSKLHAYGPMGLESLTTQKYVVLGNGQVRL